MLVKFVVGGESPEIGEFTAGDERDIGAAVAEVFKMRGMAVEVKATVKSNKKED